MIRCDFHIHTCYCDGNDTPAEIAAQAAAEGISTIGFSGHSFLSFDSCAMSESDTLRYRREISALKEKYRGTLTILCGLEKDLSVMNGKRISITASARSIFFTATEIFFRWIIMPPS